MNSWIDSFNLSISSAALLLSVMGLWFTSVISGIDRWSKRFFMSFFYFSAGLPVWHPRNSLPILYRPEYGVLYFADSGKPVTHAVAAHADNLSAALL